MAPDHVFDEEDLLVNPDAWTTCSEALNIVPKSRHVFCSDKYIDKALNVTIDLCILPSQFIYHTTGMLRIFSYYGYSK